jgi:hypothetical protein
MHGSFAALCVIAINDTLAMRLKGAKAFLFLEGSQHRRREYRILTPLKRRCDYLTLAGNAIFAGRLI